MADMGRFDQFNRRLAYDRYRRESVVQHAVTECRPATEPAVLVRS
jgi:hypothetical protein